MLRVLALALLLACLPTVQAAPRVPHGNAAAADRGYVERTFVHDGLERRYRIRLPAGGRPPTALVFLLHGHTDTIARLTGPRSPMAPWTAIADREGLVLVAPQGLRGSDGKTGWNDCRADAGINPDEDDAGFLIALSATLERAHHLTHARHYVVGISNGGMMALRMAIEHPQWTTAAGAIVAAMPARSECAPPRRAVPVMFVNGTADPLVPFDGGPVAERYGGQRGAVLSTPGSIALWTRLAGAGATPARVPLPDLDRNDDSTVVEETWSTRDGRPAVRLLRVAGGGHTEPSRTYRYPRRLHPLLGAQNGDVEVADALWRFFAAQ